MTVFHHFITALGITALAGIVGLVVFEKMDGKKGHQLDPSSLVVTTENTVEHSVPDASSSRPSSPQLQDAQVQTLHDTPHSPISHVIDAPLSVSHQPPPDAGSVSF